MNRAMLQNGETLFDRSSRGNLAGGVLTELHWHGFNRLKLGDPHTSWSTESGGSSYRTERPCLTLTICRLDNNRLSSWMAED